MEQHIESRALRQALAARERPSLPSNFAYTTMRRIRLEREKSERRQRIVAFLTVASVVVLGIGGLVYMFGQAIWQSMVAISKRPEDLSLALPTLFCLAFFALLNHWLARHYVGRDKT
ncbi:MAG: hypothetical protein IJJ73_03920 [Bacteroidaceae bacterium]|nr:hypothetical protein [Bacteroidaceae bacterium]